LLLNVVYAVRDRRDPPDELVAPRSALIEPHGAQRRISVERLHNGLPQNARGQLSKTFDRLRPREKRGIDDIYLLRVEQLYPFPTKALLSELSRFKQAEMVWCQEEPRNMGAWFFVDVFLQWILNQIGAKLRTMRYAGRPASASTAVGQMPKHLAQLKQLLEEALR